MGSALAPALRPAPEPAVAQRGQAPPLQRMALRVSSVHDAAEHEAADAARRVVRMDAPPRIAARAAGPARSPVRVQRAATGGGAALAPDTAARIGARRGGGRPLPGPLRRYMEPRFGADFSRVRVHDDAEAAVLSRRLAARAFTTGADVFFGAGQFQPDSAEGRELIAHELAHTVQQGAAPRAQVQRAEAPALSAQPEGLVQRLGLSDILDGLAALAANVPGFTLLTLIIGRNPINMRVVERTLVNVLRAFMGLIPGGEILFQVLQRYGVVDRLGTWVQQQTAALGLNFQTIRDAFTRFTDSLGWSDIFSPGDVWRRARGIFTPIIERITAFVSGLVTQAITWLKETFMEPLAGFCRQIPGYGLVTVMLGRDPFTGAAVPRSALNVVRAFAEFIPGGTEKVDQLVQSGALQRAHDWFVQETTARNLTWERVTGTFAAAWASLQLSDVLHPIDTLQRIVGLFRPLLADLVSFAGAALMKLLELIYEAAMGAGGRRILDILMRARATFLVIIRNPVGFLRNLLGAVGQGVRQFMTNILAHLRDGVIAWLTGPVARAGIQMPERWDLRGIIWFVLQILGLTWARVREKLVRLLGERVVAGLESAFALLQEIRQRGLVQALRDRVTEFFGSLRDAALGAIRSFIQQRLVMAGIQQLLSLLSPVGAVIQAIIKTYTTIQFFIQRINQILDLVESVVNSIAAIASGAIGAAANFVERTMARTIPVILDFLARFIGLGDVGAQVQRTIRELQASVDRMLDRAVDWIRRQASSLASSARGAAARVGAAVAGWWRNSRVATIGSRRATLAFAGQGRAAQLTVATSPAVPLTEFLANDPTVRALPADHAALRQVREHAAAIDAIKRGPSEGGTVADGTEIARRFGLIAGLLPQLGVSRPPPSRIRWSPMINVGGYDTAWQMIADVLSIDPAGNRGSEPTQEPPLWRAVNVRTGAYIRGHLLNHHLFGPGNRENLVPITREANAQMSSRVEEPLKTAVLSQNKVVSYRVTMAFGSRSPRVNVPAETYLPTQIVMVAWELSPGPGTGDAVWTNPVRRPFAPGTATLTHTLPADTPVGAVRPGVNLSSDGVPAMMRSFSMNPAYDPFRSRLGVLAMQIVAARMSRETAFASYDQLRTVSTLAGFGDFVEVLRGDRLVALR
ncbi:MAG: DUF4157 domain-containing protein [Piscinibacter sp.]|uniref:eCIS core domain-containing protein n=1 Tax=Piscinibacter sp. TaxID=1903157 RepID=UPI00258BF4C1|nr:DUF4157 domain-containing protein [Piscinibacter sp.]MCW5665806.1 DUF4157 domain-containing protein [Piscinibacter sp.]